VAVPCVGSLARAGDRTTTPAAPCLPRSKSFWNFRLFWWQYRRTAHGGIRTEIRSRPGGPVSNCIKVWIQWAGPMHCILILRGMWWKDRGFPSLGFFRRGQDCILLRPRRLAKKNC